MSEARSMALAVVVLFVAAGPREAESQTTGQTEAALKRSLEHCHGAANPENCYELIRLNLTDPTLLVELGDALMRASRPPDALRAYRRATVLAPNMRGVSAKISAAVAKLAPRHAPVNPAVRDASLHRESPKVYSNAAPETNSH